jgi:hypothetical protein
MRPVATLSDLPAFEPHDAMLIGIRASRGFGAPSASMPMNCICQGYSGVSSTFNIDFRHSFRPIGLSNADPGGNMFAA